MERSRVPPWRTASTSARPGGTTLAVHSGEAAAPSPDFPFGPTTEDSSSTTGKSYNTVQAIPRRRLLRTVRLRPRDRTLLLQLSAVSRDQNLVVIDRLR